MKSNEIWKDISEYEGLYQISNFGNIRSLNYRKQKGIIKELKPNICKQNGYKMICLWNNLGRKQYTIHSLVAKAFIPNPNNYPCINHKDENKLNNNVNNLEWCTYSYNLTYNNIKEKTYRPVIQLDKDNNIIKKWKSITFAAKSLNCSRPDIIRCCKGKRNCCGGYKWKYENEVI